MASSSSSSMAAQPAKAWKYIDDGSGRAGMYISASGEKTRTKPHDYVPELLHNGDRKYYYKGSCIKCKKEKFSPVVLSRDGFDEVFCFNICERCLMQGAGLDPAKSSRNRGDIIWEGHIGAPKIGIHPIRARGLDESREASIQTRTIDAQLYVLRGKKHRRNIQREIHFMNLALKYEGMEKISKEGTGVTHEGKGSYLSWGFTTFDEYFGEVKGSTGSENILSKAVPQGMGVKLYSDTSVYVGEWMNGIQHTEKKGTLLRPDGSQYEGTWLAGKRHGQGETTRLQPLYPPSVHILYFRAT